MYASFAALEGLDYVTTRRALSSGAGREANPVMQPFAANGLAFFAIKAASAAGTVWVAERLWREHPRRALLLMGAANAAAAAVVANNARVR